MSDTPTHLRPPAETDLQLIAEAAIAFLEVPDEADLFALVGNFVQRVVGPDALISVSDYDPRGRDFKPKAMLGFGATAERMMGLLGKSLSGLAGDYPVAVKQAMASGRITHVPGGVVELASGVVPEAVCRQAERLFGLHAVHVIGFVKAEQVLGGICIIARRPELPLRAETVETLVRLASVALERRRAQQEQAQLSRQLGQAQKLEAVGQLAGGVAHDFNNLLTGIIGNADAALQDLPRDHVCREDLEEVVALGRRAAALTQRLLAFSRNKPGALRPCDLNRQVSGLCDLLPRVLGEVVTIRQQLDKGLPPVLLDPVLLEQVVLNLAVNARDAMPGGGTLTLTTRRGADPAEVVLEVADTGTGMDEATRARIFEPFFTTKAEGKGTGLGLAIVYNALRQLEGRVEVHSVVGQGTRFVVSLRADEHAEPAVETTSGLDAPRGSETILVVEDEPSVRAIEERVLARLGYQVIAVGDGETALEVVRQRGSTIPLLLTDVVMPKMTGTELAQHVRALVPAIRVLFVSGYNDHFTTGTPLGPGEDLLAKPFRPAELGLRVRALLDGGR